MRRIDTMNTGMILAAAGALFAGGCARTVVEAPNNTEYAATDTTAELDFWHTLPGRPAVTNGEGIKGVMQFVEGAEGVTAYDDRAARLRELGWLPESFDEPSNMAMQRGTLAKLLAHALDIEGGMMMRLTNKSRRYAMRELVYMQLMPAGTEQQAISGLEYIGVMQKSQDYMMLREVDRRAAEAAAQGGSPAPGTDAPPADGQAPAKAAPQPGIGSPG